MAHTPGPWFLGEYRRHQIWAWFGDESQPIGQTYASSPNAGANARLIAAAPELLEACEWALALFRVLAADGIVK